MPPASVFRFRARARRHILSGSLLVVERSTWTDERLDDLAETIRSGFVRTDQDNRDLRSDLNEGFAGVRGEVQTLRTEMQHEFSSLRAVMFTFGGGIILALIGVIAAILARGA